MPKIIGVMGEYIMHKPIRHEFEKAVKKRDEIKELLQKLEGEDPADTYNIGINRDRLAYWQGKTEGLQFALDQLSSS